MKKRIEIDGTWYVQEDTMEKADFDITFSYQACSGIFDYFVCLREVDDNQRFEIMKGTECVSVYLNGRDKVDELWDNVNWLRDFRDGIEVHDHSLTDIQVAELQNLLIAVTEKGWLSVKSGEGVVGAPKSGFNASEYHY